MNKYIIVEKQNPQSIADGYRINAKNLLSAKRQASKNQCFQRTVLSIYSANDALLSTKIDGTWNDEY